MKLQRNNANRLLNVKELISPSFPPSLFPSLSLFLEPSPKRQVEHTSSMLMLRFSQTLQWNKYTWWNRLKWIGKCYIFLDKDFKPDVFLLNINTISAFRFLTRICVLKNRHNLRVIMRFKLHLDRKLPSLYSVTEEVARVPSKYYAISFINLSVAKFGLWAHFNTHHLNNCELAYLHTSM